MDVKQSKARFGIIGNNLKLNQAINVALQVAGTDISVLINGESGTGKETIPQIIHQNSKRKHNNYIAVNCGAIPEGTVDSELFGHEKGSFTGANESRKGYFEVADGGTIFLDEVGELPLPTQVRLLRVLETGEFLKVGSSKTQKTNVRIVAATNLDMPKAIQQGKFREDLFYRLSTVEIVLPPLRERNGDIHLLFRKFAADFAQKYKMPTVRLDDDAQRILQNYRWNGNIRQLKNITEQLSVLEQERAINGVMISSYLPDPKNNLPALISENKSESDFSSEREILYKILFDMKKDLNELKKLTNNLKSKEVGGSETIDDIENFIPQSFQKLNEDSANETEILESNQSQNKDDKYSFAEEVVEEETLSIQDKELELIIKALERNNGRRKAAAKELGISERTLYRKIKQYDLEL